jgi:hypothetical protein
METYNEFNNENQKSLAFDEEIKYELRNVYRNTSYAKTGILDQRIEQLMSIYKVWLAKAKSLYSAKEIAEKLFKSETNL